MLFKKIAELKKQGVSIVYISHKMDEVFQIADDITILRDGAVVATQAATELDIDKVIALMVGRRMENIYPKEDIPLGEKMFEVINLTSKGNFKNVSFHVNKGEIVGFAGLVGAGRTEVMRAIFGLDPFTSGEIIKGGKKIEVKSVKDCIQNNVVMLSEDRRRFGIVPVRSVKENATIASLEKVIYKGYTHEKEEKNLVDYYFKKMNVKTPSQDTPIRSLSGGNQQKVLLGKWMMRNPDVCILDEPTRGIDVGAKFEIYKLMTEIAKEGKAVIMISSELPELIGMCDRIYVMQQGKLTGELKKEEFSQESIMRYATGAC
jgi:inositol transport system ATP-binding protein